MWDKTWLSTGWRYDFVLRNWPKTPDNSEQHQLKRRKLRVGKQVYAFGYEFGSILEAKHEYPPYERLHAPTHHVDWQGNNTQTIAHTDFRVTQTYYQWVGRLERPLN